MYTCTFNQPITVQQFNPFYSLKDLFELDEYRLGLLILVYIEIIKHDYLYH